MEQQNAVVTQTSTVGDERTLRVQLPSGARVEVSYPAPDNEGDQFVHVVKWLTMSPSAEDKSLVGSCFPID